MGKTIHCCISVRGLLHQSKRELQRVLRTITRDDGQPFRDVEELREALMDELSRGHEVLPLGDCDNFDYKTGCKGHPTEDACSGESEPAAIPTTT